MTGPGGTTLRVDVPDGLDPGPALATLASHVVPGAQSVDVDRALHRRVLTVDGVVVPVEVHLAADAVRVRAGTSSPVLVGEVERVVRFWFDLDADLAPSVALLGADDVLGPLVRARPTLRTTRVPDGFEAAAMAVLGQQVSLARARALAGRLMSAYGTAGPGRIALLPAPERVAREPVDDLRATLGLTGARARALNTVAALFADGFVLGPDVDPGPARAELLALPGVGPWTADYLGVRATRDPDAFPAGDAVLRRVVGRAATAELAARAAAWSPWRSRAATHLWAAASAG